MKFRVGSAVLVLAALAGSSTAVHAGSATEAMTSCLVTSVSEADKGLLIQWVYVAMGRHPAVSGMSTVSPEKADDLNQKVAGILETLITQKCKAEAAAALQTEGPQALVQSFDALGQVAMGGIVHDAAVAKYLSGIAKYFDAKALQQALAPKK